MEALLQVIFMRKKTAHYGRSKIMYFLTIYAIIALVIHLVIIGALIYLFILLVKALKKYIASKEVRAEKSAVQPARWTGHNFFAGQERESFYPITEWIDPAGKKEMVFFVQACYNGKS